MPNTDFWDTESLLPALCSQLAILETEIEGASIQFLKKLLREAMNDLPCLVVVDDVDSTDLGQQKMILETVRQLSSSRSRFILTTRLNLGISGSGSITVGGLEKDDYKLYVQNLLENMKGVELTPKEIEQLRVATDGSPLFTDSLIRLYRSGIPLSSAIKQWRDKLGTEVRKAALKREIDRLTPEACRILLACAHFREASFTELKQVTGYNDERMHGCVAELQSLFLISAPEFIKKESRFKVNTNTALLVLELAKELIADPVALEKVVAKVRNKIKTHHDKPRIGAAINQTLALMKDNRLPDSLATIDAALKEEPENPDLLFTKGWCIYEKYKLEGNSKDLENARNCFKKAHSKGAKKGLLFKLWFDCELQALHPNGCIEVATFAIQNDSFYAAEWYRKRADAYIRLSKAHEQSLNADAALDEMVNASTDLFKTLSITKQYERVPLLELLHQVNDEVWRILNLDIENVPATRKAFDLIRHFVKQGDERLANFERILLLVEKVRDFYSQRDKLRDSHQNQAEQIVRQTGELLSHVSPKRIGYEEQKKIRQRLKLIEDSLQAMFE